jgi:hypothetical protein
VDYSCNFKVTLRKESDMPIYEYECPSHGIIEVYTKVSDDRNFIRCQTYLEDHQICNREAERIFSLPSMHPDKHWNGTMVGNKYVTSSKEYKDATKNFDVATRDRLEYVQKQLPKRRKELEDKQDNARIKFLEKELASA